jgi:hypothetical protein
VLRDLYLPVLHDETGWEDDAAKGTLRNVVASVAAASMGIPSPHLRGIQPDPTHYAIAKYRSSISGVDKDSVCNIALAPAQTQGCACSRQPAENAFLIR